MHIDNTTPPLMTPQVMAVGGIWDSDVDAVVNKKDMNQNRQRVSKYAEFTLQMTKGQAMAVLFHSLSLVYTDVDGEG